MNESRKFGALWVKQNDRGEYMSGEMTINGQKIGIVCFRNTLKEDNPKCPDWDILKSEDKNKGLTI